MARYIDADKLLDDIGLRKGITANEVINGVPDKGIRPMDAPHCWFILSIMYAPTADVRENVKGKWVEQPDEPFASSYCCSNCKEQATVDLYGEYVFSNYCPHCGADMRGEK